MGPKIMKLGLFLSLFLVAACVDLSHLQNEFRAAKEKEAHENYHDDYPLALPSSEVLDHLKEILVEIKHGKANGNDYGTLFQDANLFKQLELYDHYPAVNWKLKFKKYHLKWNPNYCNQVDLLNMLDSENVFKNEYTNSMFIARIVNDVLKKRGGYLGQIKQNGLYKKLPIRTTLFWGDYPSNKYIHDIGVNHLCLSQLYPWIPGLEAQTLKQLVPGTVRAYNKTVNNLKCFDPKKFYPDTYYLHSTIRPSFSNPLISIIFKDPQQCREFFAYINSREYAEAKAKVPAQFFMKTTNQWIHQGKGVQLMSAHKEEELKRVYKNGELCDRKLYDTIIQKNVHNPLLIYKGNKFDFRVYVLVVSTNPLIAYFYRDGWVRASVLTFDPHSMKEEDHLTNTHVTDPIINRIKSREERSRLIELQLGLFDRLSKDLKEKGRITDEAAFINELKNKMKNSVAHIMRMNMPHLYNSSNVYKFLGLDFMLEDNMNLVFIETNNGPQMFQSTSKNQKFMEVMHNHTLDLMYAYLRSRIKRLREFFFEAYEVLEVNRGPSVIDALKKEFKRINKNYLEPEYQISAENGWEKIIDGNLPGKEMFMGHLDESCFE